MNYKQIETPEELMNYMNENISYGIFDYTKNKAYYGEDDNFGDLVNTTWKLSSPAQMQKYGVGHCFDQVELERDFFTKNNYNFKTYFIWFKCKRPNNYPTHTYLIYEDKKTNKWCWFEHSDFVNRGIRRFNSLNDAIKAQAIAHIKHAKSYRKTKTDSSKIEVFEYRDVKYGINFNDFLDYVLTNGKPINID